MKTRIGYYRTDTCGYMSLKTAAKPKIEQWRD